MLTNSQRMAALHISFICICLWLSVTFAAIIGEKSPNVCTPETAANCIVDEFVGSDLIYEDAVSRIWNFTLLPGEMTSMHSHDCNYHFVALRPTTLEVYGASGGKLFSFLAAGTMGFQVIGDELVQNTPSPQPIDYQRIRVPRIHAAKNIGQDIYQEILIESKLYCSSRNTRNEITTSSSEL